MRLFRAAATWLQVAGATIALLAIIWLGAQAGLHLKLLDVQTGSMRPVFRPGDALIIRRPNPARLQAGEIVSYHSPRNFNELVTHRVVKVDATSSSFQTKGDRLTTPDPAVRDSLLAGQVVAILPSMGQVLAWFQTMPGLIVCVYIPALAIGVSELYRLEQHYKRFRSYQLYDRQVI